MASHLNKLKLKKILAEHTYYVSEIDYKSEIVKEAEPEFLKAIHSYLKHNPDLLKNMNTFLDNSRQETAIENAKDGVNEKIPPSDFEKQVFREISKVAHPDKLAEEDADMTELYIEASNAYTEHDVITLYKMAIQLNLDVEIDANVIIQIQQQIETMKEQSTFMEQNLAYQWLVCESIEEKQKLLDYYIDNMTLNISSCKI